MLFKRSKYFILSLKTSAKWFLISVFVGLFVGSASALFLFLLDKVCGYQKMVNWFIFLLPLAGFLVALIYHYWGREISKGNNLLLLEIQQPKKIIPVRMAPMVLLGTLVSHLFGASVGREGTAVQMGAALADRFTLLFKLNHEQRRILLLMGVSAGFSSVFGTPLAGFVFALEVTALGKVRWQAFIPTVLVAFMAHYVCLCWGIEHTNYEVSFFPNSTVLNFLLVMVVGVCCGLCALLFVKCSIWSDLGFKKFISFSPLRTLIGGIVIVGVVSLLGTNIYNSLGIETIEQAFKTTSEPHVFMVKFVLTVLAVSSGFKGGEVTPLFFIGATLASATAAFIPLPANFLAAMGFVAVFAAATNTPLACTIMGMELFGANYGIYLALVCVTAYVCSGKNGLYSSQKISW